MLRVGINVSFKMVPHFPKLSGHSPSYSEPTDLLADFSLILIFSWFWCTANPKTKEINGSTAQTSSHHVCEEDCCLNRPNLPIIDGDMRLDSGWFWGGFEVVGHLTHDVPRWKLGKKNTPTMAAAIVPRPPWCRTPGTEVHNNHPTCYTTSWCR